MAKVRNLDVRGLHNRVIRFIEEIRDSSSANSPRLTQGDRKRHDDWIAAFRAYIAWVTGSKELDLTKSFPKEYELDALPESKTVENELINDILDHYYNLEEEIAKSNSANVPSGFLAADVVRWNLIIQRVEDYLKQYADQVTPLDFAESSAKNTSVGPGRSGVKE